jgi:hypothetical protein
LIYRDDGNAGVVRPANVPYNAAIPYVHAGQIFTGWST